uniref:Uncharacterized protein n=1 Tax=Avena sativa TaxID=4498 RepID=A0ACD5VLS5_AVESA
MSSSSSSLEGAVIVIATALASAGAALAATAIYDSYHPPQPQEAPGGCYMLIQILQMVKAAATPDVTDTTTTCTGILHALDAGRADPVVGRDDEIDRVVCILCRRTKNCAALVGAAGVGKTAIVEGLAQRIAAGNVPDALAGARIMEVDMGAMVAGTQWRGMFEQRLKDAIKQAEDSDGKVILFIDEMHMIVGAGDRQGTGDAANILKPSLARGRIRCVGATTSQEYQKYIATDAALERRF